MEHQEEEEVEKRRYCRFKYKVEDLKKAIEEVKAGKLSINKASQVYSIPKGTLVNKLKSDDPFLRKMGPPSVLSQEEEKRLKDWILDKAKLGFPMHEEDLKDAVQKVLNDSKRTTIFNNNRPGKKWVELFLKRHPEISKRNTEVISKARATVTESKLREWFDELTCYLHEENAKDVLQDPKRLYNLDETGVSVCPKSGKLLGPKKYRNFYEIAAGPEKECITVLCTFSAAGDSIDPMIVYAYKRIPRDVAESVPPGFAVGRSDSGWMVSATFYEYMANVFYPRIAEAKVKMPVLVFLDGHKSHINVELYEFCKEKNILLFCLLPNATHVLQPCDVSIFRPLKTAWKKLIRNFKQKTSKALTKVNFAPLFRDAYNEVTTKAIVNGFKACGLYPFNPNNVDYSKCISTRREQLGKVHKSVESTSVAEHKIALKVIESVIGEDSVGLFQQIYNREEEPEDVEIKSIFLVWREIKEVASEEVFRPSKQTNATTNAVNKEREKTEQFHSDENNLIGPLPISKQGCSTTPIPGCSRGINEEDFPHKTTEDAPTQQNETVLSVCNSSLGESGSPRSDPWDKHLYWPKKEEGQTKKRKQEKVPYAMTSKKWKLYHDNKLKIKEEKESATKMRKIERESKKNIQEKDRQDRQRKQQLLENWRIAKNIETKQKLAIFKFRKN